MYIQTYSDIKILKKTDLWNVLNGLATFFGISLPNRRGMAAQPLTIFGRGLPVTIWNLWKIANLDDIRLLKP
jgi:hypothetical protein